MISTLINKEEINNYSFVPAPENKSQTWFRELIYAVRLGNEFKGKTTITFETNDGSKTVETTVWSVTDHYLQLKGGVSIPLNSIIDIHF